MIASPPSKWRNCNAQDYDDRLALAGKTSLYQTLRRRSPIGEISYTDCVYTNPADPSCPRCYKKASAILWGITGDWEAACRSTPNPKLGGRYPDWCATALNQWGNWWVKCSGPIPPPQPCPGGANDVVMAVARLPMATAHRTPRESSATPCRGFP